MDNNNIRTAIRRGWGSQKRVKDRKLQLYFLVGKRYNNLKTNYLYREMKLHNDIIQADFYDTYKNLSLKTMEMLRWTIDHCRKPKYLLKVDDDTFVRMEPLVAALEEHEHNGHVDAIFGNLYMWRQVHRNVESEYYVPYSVWQNKSFPPLVTGPAYVISNSVVERLYTRAKHENTTFVTMEDVFITGIVRNLENIPVYDIPAMKHKTTFCRNDSDITLHRVYEATHYILWKNKFAKCGANITRNLGPEDKFAQGGMKKVKIDIKLPKQTKSNIAKPLIMRSRDKKKPTKITRDENKQLKTFGIKNRNVI